MHNKKKIIQELSDHFETNFSLQKLDSKTVNETIREFRSILEKGTELVKKVIIGINFDIFNYFFLFKVNQIQSVL